MKYFFTNDKNDILKNKAELVKYYDKIGYFSVSKFPQLNDSSLESFPTRSSFHFKIMPCKTVYWSSFILFDNL